jgi:hypothetical protein
MSLCYSFTQTITQHATHVICLSRIELKCTGALTVPQNFTADDKAGPITTFGFHAGE